MDNRYNRNTVLGIVGTNEEHKIILHRRNVMKCPKCNSENVHIQAKEYKPRITFPCCLTFASFGLMFSGIIGLVAGVLLGLLVSAILYAIIPTGYSSVMVCQQCGFVGTNTTSTNVAPNYLFCMAEESNLLIVRRSNSFGIACKLGIKIDNHVPFEICDNELRHLKLEQGAHTITYYQVNGMGKKHRKGVINITIGSDCRMVEFEFQRVGLKSAVL